MIDAIRRLHAWLTRPTVGHTFPRPCDDCGKQVLISSNSPPEGWELGPRTPTPHRCVREGQFMSGIEIVNEVPTPTCPKCGKPADLEARSGMWIHFETSSPRCAKPSVMDQSYKAQCAALEKTVQDLRERRAAAERERDEARVAGIQDARTGVRVMVERDRLRDILTAAREALNGGESSEGDFAEHLAQHMKVCTAQWLQLREDVGNWQKRAEALTAERDEANRLLGEAAEALSRVVTERDIARDEKAEPVPMILSCPECCERHIDRGKFAERPHHTHACQSCGFVWRPAVVATVGVHFLPGFRDGDVAVASSRFGMSA